MNSFPIERFIALAKEKGHSEDYIEACVGYAKKLMTNQYPVLFTLEHLAIAMGVKSSFLRWLIGDLKTQDIVTNPIFELKQKRYQLFSIKKRRGGRREIMAPDKDLKYIQKWITFNILDKYPLKESCKGFRQNISIKDNALVHEGASKILKVDLLKFYDTITEERVYGVFKNMGYQGNLAVSLSKLCTYKHSSKYWNSFKSKEKEILSYYIKEMPAILPQGCPSSPMLANIIASKMDFRFEELAKKMNFSYSRYADDLTFSIKENGILPSVSFINKIITDEGFYMNSEKVKYMLKGQKQYVTGLTVTNGVHTSKKYRKKIARHIHFCRKFGVERHLTKVREDFLGYTTLNFHDWLYGHICFIHSIDKEYSEQLLKDFNKINWFI
ncbi:reverse transcriptase family protein [Chryseobacterium tructae]|uniref:RNA-directed DNA polymerase n=1 Tax=Chryseobacterium tructae TaxID=1037380 RepID=A0ABV7XVV5_9FLAO|nr:reverse transcriptase family protein [Chryseobacterium tructae]MDN3692179.1 reverse transcriptase family protein [Chryseobacterium tructae]